MKGVASCSHTYTCYRFIDVSVEVGWTMEKRVERFEGEFGDKGRPNGDGQGEVMEFPFLICMGKKP